MLSQLFGYVRRRAERASGLPVGWHHGTLRPATLADGAAGPAWWILGGFEKKERRVAGEYHDMTRDAMRSVSEVPNPKSKSGISQWDFGVNLCRKLKTRYPLRSSFLKWWLGLELNQ